MSESGLDTGVSPLKRLQPGVACFRDQANTDADPDLALARNNPATYFLVGAGPSQNLDD